MEAQFEPGITSINIHASEINTKILDDQTAIDGKYGSGNEEVMSDRTFTVKSIFPS